MIKNDPLDIFLYLYRILFILPLLQIMLELLIAAKFNQVHDIFLQFCLPSYPVKATKDVIEEILWNLHQNLIYFQFSETLFEVFFNGVPYMMFVLPCIVIYSKLMKFISERPIIRGIDPVRENVRSPYKIGFKFCTSHTTPVCKYVSRLKVIIS